MWRLLLIVAVMVVFIPCSLSATTHNCGGESANRQDTSIKKCISAVIQSDDSVGKIRNHACETVSLSLAIRNYLAALDGLDIAACPEDFTAAFTKHKQAWLNMLAITDKYPNFRGEMHILFDQLKNSNDAAAFNERLDKIWETWAQVEKSIRQ